MKPSVLQNGKTCCYLLLINCFGFFCCCFLVLKFYSCLLFLFTHSFLHTTVHLFVHSFIRNLIHFVAYTIKRGDTFRGLLNRVGELRSLFPVGVNIMALTATAMKQVRMRACRTLGMAHPFIVALSPCKHNIMYSVFKDIETTFKPIATC